ncbi:helix-turn-helix transcriptional regulator [Kaistella sp. PBT33-4]|uniref:helix-turn-helix domain-containing protein n=1 Tax=Kaistella sp. PBT33-4 TaxID=3032000 RepID=UPI0023D8916D|nr:helix-turn-helix transcriptional regulator [Kaistella sp. PBT33-4]MDF0718793.1 helix-turn-helix transcriptional regulator [Kaistella sp. PBT33-4]
MSEKLEFQKAVGLQIEKFRNQQGLSYRQLAQRCEVDHSNISKMEKGEIDMRISTLMEIAKGLSIHPTELLNFEFDITASEIEE